MEISGRRMKQYLPLPFPPFQNLLCILRANQQFSQHYALHTTRYSSSVPFPFSTLHLSIPSLISIALVFSFHYSNLCLFCLSSKFIHINVIILFVHVFLALWLFICVRWSSSCVPIWGNNQANILCFLVSQKLFFRNPNSVNLMLEYWVRSFCFLYSYFNTVTCSGWVFQLRN